jgi:hypothetical protein
MNPRVKRYNTRLPQILMCALIAFSLHACKQPGKAPANKKGTVTKTQTKTLTTPSPNTVTDTTGMDECPRGVAEPVVKKGVFPDARFTLQPDKRTGIETLTLKGGDKLILTQSGCEYYRLNFRFETSRFAADTGNVPYWGNAALSLMRQVASGLDVPLEIDTALSKLSARLDRDKSHNEEKLALGEEIDFVGPDPRQYLIIERVTRLADQRYAVEISLSYGPI